MDNTIKNDVILTVDNLKKYFPIRKGLLRHTVGHAKAVDGISFDLRKGETLGLVGESGCGKTTAGRCILRLIEPTDGQIMFSSNGSMVDLCALKPRALRACRPHLQMIFQDPISSLNPRMTISDIVGEPLKVNHVVRGSELEERAGDLLEQVGLRRSDLRKYPHAFSGGQRQRIGVARALALNPDIIIADEPVSALDVSVQAQILNLLAELRNRLQLSYIFIAHDLSVVEHISDRVAVMYLGRIVEISDADTLYSTPKHPYTEALMSAVPIPDPKRQRERRRIRLEGDVPDPSSPPAGCHFHPRCRYAQAICREQDPVLRTIGSSTRAACHFADELTLKGI